MFYRVPPEKRIRLEESKKKSIGSVWVKSVEVNDLICF